MELADNMLAMKRFIIIGFFILLLLFELVYRARACRYGSNKKREHQLCMATLFTRTKLVFENSEREMKEKNEQESQIYSVNRTENIPFKDSRNAFQ